MNGRWRSFMAGRYGQDDLNRLLSIVVLVLMVASMIFGWSALYQLALVLFIVCFFRMLSKNTVMRGRENSYYLGLRFKVTRWFRGRINRFRQRKTHRFYRCPSCHAQLRAPKGRGRLSLTCPKCRATFVKKT